MSDWEFEDADQQTVKEAFTKLTEHERHVIAKMIRANQNDDNLNFLKNFIIGFDKDCPLESVICRIMTQVGQHIGTRLFKEIKKIKVYSGSMAMKSAIEEIRLVADIIEGTVQQFEDAKQGH
jgi:hypothetical protein